MGALLLVALSLGLSNFTAATGIGIPGASARIRLKVGLIFAVFETGMPITGLALGHGLARALGGAAHWISAGLLIATGAWSPAQVLRSSPGDASPAGSQRTGQLMLTGFALSIDNLAVGFALGAFGVSVATAVAVIGSVSIALSLVGLELGARIGARAGRRGEILGALVLVAVGIAVAAGII